MTRLERQNGRLPFMDTIRWMIVLAVLVLHTACAYANIIPWWNARDAELRPAFDLLILVLDVFVMPVLFFVAGYFAEPSLARRSGGDFVAAKAKRLILPMLLLLVFYLPGMVYLGHLHRSTTPLGFFDFWLDWMRSGLDFAPRLFVDMESSAGQQDVMSQHHLWFVSLLFLFFLGFLLWRRMERRPSEPTAAPPTGRAMLAATAVFCGLSAIGMSAVNMFMPDWSWFKWSALILFQPTRLPLYAVFFAFGVYACRRNWFTEDPFPGGVLLWGVSTVLFLAALLAFGRSLMQPGGASPGLALAHGAVRTLAAFSALALLVNVALRRWNAPGRASGVLAGSSYDIYLLHMPVVVFLQTLLLAVGVSVYVKFGLAAVVGALICLALSRYLVRPHPRAAVGVLLVAFLAACAFIR